MWFLETNTKAHHVYSFSRIFMFCTYCNKDTL